MPCNLPRQHTHTQTQSSNSKPVSLCRNKTRTRTLEGAPQLHRIKAGRQQAVTQQPPHRLFHGQSGIPVQQPAASPDTRRNKANKCIRLLSRHRLYTHRTAHDCHTTDINMHNTVTPWLGPVPLQMSCSPAPSQNCWQ